MTPDQPDEATRRLTPLSEPGAHAVPADLDYEMVRLIGRGGYGEVWLVRVQSGDFRACKVVYRDSFQNARPYEREYEGICRFEPVSRANDSQLKILHVGRQDAAGYFYYLMELADDLETGGTVHPEHYTPRTLRSELLRKKKLPANECIQIGLSLGAALENLHRNGLIHRDIKPGNIVFVNGVPKLADIGLVTDLDVTISYVGTEGFIPPEGPISPRADIYGLGKVLYEMSTGKDRLEYPELPVNFAEDPEWERLLELNAVITKACEPNPNRRYASAKALHADLELLAAGKSVRQRRRSRRRWALAGKVVAGLVVIGALAAGYETFSKYRTFPVPGAPAKIPAIKIPLPDAAKIAECSAKLKETYRDQLRSGTAAVKQQVAAQLVKRSSTELDPAMQFASLQMAAQLTIEAADAPRAMQTCDRMAERFQMKILPLKADLLSQASSYVRVQAGRLELADACLIAGFEAIAADDYASARKIAALGQSAAHTAGNVHLQRQAEFLSTETDRCANEFERVKQSAAVLGDKPDDPDANEAMGKFLCFVKNDWSKGISCLMRGNDEALKRVAIDENDAGVRSAQDKIDLGNLWWDLATNGQEQAACQSRARYWYLKGIAGSAEPDKSHLRQELAPRITAVPTQSGEVTILTRVGGAETIDIYSDEVQWRSSRRGAVGNKINHVNLGEFTAGDLEVVKNSEAMWLLPADLDFSSARLATDRKPTRHGRTDLTVFDDHIRVVLAHPQAGAATIEVTVTFGSPPSQTQ